MAQPETADKAWWAGPALNPHNLIPGASACAPNSSRVEPARSFERLKNGPSKKSPGQGVTGEGRRARMLTESVAGRAAERRGVHGHRRLETSPSTTAQEASIVTQCPARERAASDESALRLTSSDESEPARNTSSDESVGDRRLGSRLFRRKRDVLHLFRRKCTVLSFVLIGVLSSRPQDLSTLLHLPARPPDGGLLGVGSLSLMCVGMPRVVSKMNPNKHSLV